MMSLYYQYGTGGSPAMQGPDYQTFLALLEQMRKMNGGSPADGGGSGGGQQGQGGGGMSGLGSLFKMFGGGGSAAPSMGGIDGSVTPGYFDTPSGGMGGMGGIAGMFA